MARQYEKAAAPARPRRRRRKDEPVEVRLTVRFRFGDRPEDVLTLMDDRRVPMVGSVFAYRDAILRAFALMMVRAGTASPKVMRDLLPFLRRLGARGE